MSRFANFNNFANSVKSGVDQLITKKLDIRDRVRLAPTMVQWATYSPTLVLWRGASKRLGVGFDRPPTNYQPYYFRWLRSTDLINVGQDSLYENGANPWSNDNWTIDAYHKVGKGIFLNY